MVGAGEAVRLFTGSVVPRGADTVVLQEDCTREGGGVRLDEAARPARHIRRAGQDFSAGDVVLRAGRRLGARRRGAGGGGGPSVARGAQAAEVGDPGDGRRDQHARRAGGARGDRVVEQPRDRGAGARGGRRAGAAAGGARRPGVAGSGGGLVAGHDLLVTTGGASVGDHDLVHAALTARGMRTGFWRVAMRPGKPLMSGRLGEVAVLGLPGNPVSSLVCSVLFLLPALRVLLGGEAGGPPVARARLGVALRANDHRADHLRATLEDGPGGPVATPFAVQDSAMLAALARADCLVLRAPHAPALEAGAEVEVIRLDGLGL